MKRKTSLEDTVLLPVVLVSAADETQEVSGEPRRPGGLDHRVQIVIRTAAALLLLSVAGLLVYGMSGSSDTPAVGPVNLPPPSPEQSAPAAATETMTVPTTTAASAKVKAKASNSPTTASTTIPPTQKSTTADTSEPAPPDYSAILRSIEERYHPHHH